MDFHEDILQDTHFCFKFCLLQQWQEIDRSLTKTHESPWLFIHSDDKVL